MPPMLHVAFFELVAAGEKDLFAGDGRAAIDERHHVLQLIAEAKCSSGLMEGRTRPDAARQSLIKQPAVQHCVHCRIRSLYFNRAEKIIPVCEDAFKRLVDVSSITEFSDQRLRRFRRLSFAEQKDEFAPFMRRQFNSRL